MTVKELMLALAKQPPDRRVVVAVADDTYCDAAGVGRAVLEDGSVFIGEGPAPEGEVAIIWSD
jgi:hypothetical protein